MRNPSNEPISEAPHRERALIQTEDIREMRKKK
jgi:hypothetical protein